MHRNRIAARSFTVADVQPTTTPLPEILAQEAIESRLRSSEAHRRAEAWSRDPPRLVAPVGSHAVVDAIHLAFVGHRPLTFSPDMVWLLLCQGVALHVGAHVERLRPRLVNHPGRITLEIEVRDDPRFRKGSGETPWPEVFDSLSAQLGNHLLEDRDPFLPEFSTTGPVERLAAHIVLLDAFQGYFHGRLTEFVCGIPTITLEGSAADWRAIVDRLRVFAGLDLEWWMTLLRPVLRQFAAASAGDVDRRFWRALYRPSGDEPCAAAATAAGWFCVFFPYLVDPGGSPSLKNPRLSGAPSLDDLSESGPPYVGEFPSGLSMGPLSWVQRDVGGPLVNRWEMELLAGFVGVAQDLEALSLRPEIGWAVRERPTRDRPGTCTGAASGTDDNDARCPWHAPIEGSRPSDRRRSP